MLIQPAEVPADTEPVARGSLRLLADRTFGAFFFGKLLSTSGIWVHNVASAIVVFQLTRSAFLVGAVSVAQFVPQILTPWSGSLADRGDRRLQLIAGRVISTAGSGGLACWVWLVGLDATSGPAAVIAASFVVGVGFAIGGPAQQALIPSLVRPSELSTAVALNALPFTLGRTAGPALGAALVIGLGPEAAFAFAALTNALFAAVLTRLPLPRHRPGRAGGDTSIFGGMRYLRADRGAVALILGAAAIGIGTDPVITLTPAIAHQLGGEAQLVGVLVSTFGVGSGVGFLLLRRAQRRLGLPRLGSGGLVLLAAAFLMLAVSPAPTPAIAALAIAGVGMTFALTSLTTQLHQRVPDEVRGRVMAIWSIAFLGSRPIAASMNGALADGVSIAAALVVVTAVLVAGAVLARPGRVTLESAWTPGAPGNAPPVGDRPTRPATHPAAHD